MVESCDQIKAIGGYFELADNDCNKGKLPVDGVALNTCRNALEYIILHLSYVKRIFVPYYTCEAVIEPLLRLSIKFEFYHIDENLELAEEILLREGDYLIVNNYFGVKDSYMEQLVDKYRERLIIDNAQALFAPTFPNIKAVYSVRKFVGVADGGFAVGVPVDLSFDYEIDDSSEHDSHLLIRKEMGAEAGFKDYQANECKLDNQSIRRMSTQTQSILLHVDYEVIKERRRQNYRWLRDALEKENLLHLPSMDSFACPMVYPFMTNDVSLRERLIDNKVFVALYWPNVLRWCKEFDLENKLANKILPLPIDQRYRVEEMSKIVTIIKG